VVLTGPRKHQRLALERRRSYFGFELDTEVEPLEDEVPEPLQPAARAVLADALLAGETPHADQARLRRSLENIDELWRRSGGTLPAISPAARRAQVREQLEPVTGWQSFLHTRIILDPETLVDAETRRRLEALPGMLRIRGDAAPLDYEVEDGTGVVRVRLREGQAKRLRLDELPPLDRPLRFAVQRGRHAPLLADDIPALQAQLRRRPERDRSEDESPHHRRKRSRRYRRSGRR
jgi:hypothetical protein